MTAHLAARELELPRLSVLGATPFVPADVYERRVAKLQTLMEANDLDSVVIYADREHFANAAYFTGFDPRFEEALIVVGPRGVVSVIAGNECAPLARATLDGSVVVVLCQMLSLPGQDQGVQPRLGDALTAVGLQPGDRVGLVGWKTIDARRSRAAAPAFAVPHFVVDALSAHVDGDLADVTEHVCGRAGLRAFNEAEQLALQEYRATLASQHVWRALEAVEVGRSEREIATRMMLDGTPLSCHVMCTSGPDVALGLLSPSDRQMEDGDALSIGVGLLGGLCARAGRVLRAADASRSAHAPLTTAYVSSVFSWYDAVRVGARTSDVVAAVEQAMAPTGLRPMLNPGHQTHLDEWMNSPFSEGDDGRLVSGAALQVDIIPVAAHDATFVANMEDAVGLADSDLRDELRSRYPEMWSRVQARRAVMTDLLGLELDESVLPFSDRQGLFSVGILDPGVVLAR